MTLYKNTKAVSISWNGRTLWKGYAGALAKFPWVVTPTSPFCFETRRLPVLLFWWWKFIDVQMENQILSTRWCWDQKWLDVRMSRTSNTEVCESRKAMCLTSPKGSMTARVTSSFNVADCFDTDYQKTFGFLYYYQAKVLPTLLENAVMLLHLLVIWSLMELARWSKSIVSRDNAGGGILLIRQESLAWTWLYKVV